MTESLIGGCYCCIAPWLVSKHCIFIDKDKDYIEHLPFINEGTVIAKSDYSFKI